MVGTDLVRDYVVLLLLHGASPSIGHLIVLAHVRGPIA